LKAIITCVVCPVSCPVEVEYHEHEILSIDRNQCKLALEYVRNEMFDPRRVVTTSVEVEGGAMPLVSVKTDRPIPKTAVSDAMKTICAVRVRPPVRTGDVIVRDLLGTGANVVATRDVDAYT
jgi:CxxC motif-containing protein